MRSDSDLGQMLMAALDVRPVANAVEASARYGGTELRAAEQARAEQRRAADTRAAEPLRRWSRCWSFRQAVAERLMRSEPLPFPERGRCTSCRTVKRVQWGTLEATNGVLISDDGTRRLPGPVRIDGATLTGDGWTVTVAPGWTRALRASVRRLPDHSRPAVDESGTPDRRLANTRCTRRRRGARAIGKTSLALKSEPSTIPVGI